MLRGRGRALGYLVVPPDLVDSFAAQSVTNRHAPLLEQAILTDFIADGHFGRHVRRTREVHAERLGVLIESAREQLKGLLDISEVEAGLQTVGWLQRGIDGIWRARRRPRECEAGPRLTRSHRERRMGFERRPRADSGHDCLGDEFRVSADAVDHRG